MLKETVDREISKIVREGPTAVEGDKEKLTKTYLSKVQIIMNNDTTVKVV